MGTSWEELLPLLLLGGSRRDLLPLLLLFGGLGSSGSTHDADDSNLPSTFDAYLSSLVGDYVRVSVSTAVDNAMTLVGNLHRVGSDFIVLRDVVAAGVTLEFRVRVVIPISNIVGIDRLPFFDRILPLLGTLSSGS